MLRRQSLKSIGSKKGTMGKCPNISTGLKKISKASIRWFRIFMKGIVTTSIYLFMQEMPIGRRSEGDQRRTQEEMGWNQQRVSKDDSCKVDWYHWFEEKEGKLRRRVEKHWEWHQKAKQIICFCWLTVILLIS